MPRIVVVTGANRGIGHEVARQLAARGDTVILTARDEAKAQQAASRLTGLSGGVVARQLDVTDAGSVRRLADVLDAEHGHGASETGSPPHDAPQGSPYGRRNRAAPRDYAAGVTATDPDVRAALIGYGVAGEIFHAPLISATPGMRLATVVTSNAERQARARRDHPGVRILERVDDLWDSSAGHDLAVVATPNREHVPIASAALAAGLAVVVDKPMAPTAAQARGLIDAARRQQRLLTVFHNRRWDSEILTLQRVLAEERLGRVLRVESRFERWRPEVKQRWRESADPEDAGGLLFDLGTHLIDQALYLFGSPQRVYAEIDRRRADAAVDDDVFLALGFPDALDVHLWMSAVAAGGAPRLRVLGLRGTFVRERLDTQEDALRAGAHPAGDGWGREPEEMWGRVLDDAGAHPVDSVPGAWPTFYTQLVAALREDAPVPVPPEAAVAVLEVIEAARESAATYSVVALGRVSR